MSPAPRLLLNGQSIALTVGWRGREAAQPLKTSSLMPHNPVPWIFQSISKNQSFASARPMLFPCCPVFLGARFHVTVPWAHRSLLLQFVFDTPNFFPFFLVEMRFGGNFCFRKNKQRTELKPREEHLTQSALNSLTPYNPTMRAVLSAWSRQGSGQFIIHHFTEAVLWPGVLLKLSYQKCFSQPFH